MALPRRLPTTTRYRNRGAARGLIGSLLLALASGCGGGEGFVPQPDLHEARVALGASFVGGRAAGLRERLGGDLIVQPPAPDSPLRGDAAVAYLERLARGSRVTRSELVPDVLSREGTFLLERGGWHLESGDRTFASRYIIRWADSPAGWKVALWRWTLFR